MIIYIKLNLRKYTFKKKNTIYSNEDKILLKLNHKNIIKLIKVEKKYNLYKILYLENFDSPSLSRLNVDNFLNESDWENSVKNIIFQVLSGLEHIHNQGYIHNDIHPGNILYNHKSKKIMIIDFDSCVTDKYIVKSIGSRYYTAPEKVKSYIKGSPISFKIDIYSLGCIFHVLLTGFTIYYSVRANKIHEKNDQNNGISLDHLNNYSKDCLNLLYKMLYKNPKKRISTQKAINHNWFIN